MDPLYLFDHSGRQKGALRNEHAICRNPEITEPPAVLRENGIMQSSRFPLKLKSKAYSNAAHDQVIGAALSVIFGMMF